MKVIHKKKEIEVEFFDSATYVTKKGVQIPIGETTQKINESDNK